MSDEVFPTLAGLSWGNTKRPKFNSVVQSSVNLTELRASYTATPVYSVTLKYDVLRDNELVNELKTLVGFFLARRGRFDSFLFLDGDDSVATDQSLGVGNATEVEFQLVRSYGSFTEKVSNGITISEVTVSNTPTSNYTVSSTGLITFNSAPAANAPIAWSGTYYYRARFLEDESEFENFMYKLWNNQTVDMLMNLGTKL